MTCLHNQILIEWWTQGDEDGHRAACQECGQVFAVYWVEHGDPGPETNWKSGKLQGIELGEEE